VALRQGRVASGATANAHSGRFAGKRDLLGGARRSDSPTLDHLDHVGASVAIPNLSWQGSSASVNGFGMSDWLIFPFIGSSTPVTMTLGIYTTALPPGHYSGVLTINTNAASNAPRVIPIAYDVAAP
jgi:hypothetical protein